MKILNVLLDDRLGGPHIRLFTIAEQLRNEGIDFVQVYPWGKGEMPVRSENLGFTTYRCRLLTPHFIRNFHTLLLNILYLITFFPAIYSLIKIIKSENIDVVHAHGFPNIQGAIAGFLTGTPVVWHLHATLYPELIVRIMSPLLGKLATRIIHISSTTRDFYRINYPYKEVIINEPVDTEKFNPKYIEEGDRIALRKELKISAENRVITAVGNITWVKGYEYLLKAFRGVKEKYPEANLLIAGKILSTQMNYFNKLQELIKRYDLAEVVKIPGKRDDIQEILSISDLFVNSSLSEGTPIAILEAMSMKLPVISSNTGGIGEIIEDGVTGKLVSTENLSENLEENITELLQEKDRAVKMGERGRKSVVNRFSAKNSVEEHRAVYLSLAESGHKSILKTDNADNINKSVLSSGYGRRCSVLLQSFKRSG